MNNFTYNLKQLLTEDIEDTIINSLNYEPEIAYEISNLSKEHAFWLAKNIKKYIEENTDFLEKMPKNNLTKLRNIYRDAGFEDIEKKEIYQKMFKLYFKEFKAREWGKLRNIVENLFNVQNKPRLNIKELDINTAQEYLEKLNYINDWKENQNENIDLTQISWEVAYDRSREWHISLATNQRNKINKSEEKNIIISFNDGYFWKFIGAGSCKEEGAAMGHCGSSGTDDLYSLRDGQNKPHITAAFRKEGNKNILTQMKGKGNERPISKYHPYIVDLLGDKNFNVTDIDYRFGQGGQYGKDFNPMDLNEKLGASLYGKNKFMRKFLNAPQRLVNKYKNKYKELKEEGWSINISPYTNIYEIKFPSNNKKEYDDLKNYKDIKPKNISIEIFVMVIKVLNELKRNNQQIQEEIERVEMFYEIRRMKNL